MSFNKSKRSNLLLSESEKCARPVRRNLASRAHHDLTPTHGSSSKNLGSSIYIGMESIVFELDIAYFGGLKNIGI